MTTIRRIVTSKIEGSSANNTTDDEIRPFGEINVYIDNNRADKLVLAIHDGVRTHLKSKVLEPGVFYGSGDDSGDGAGLDTIKLIPDSELYYNSGNYGNDQYIIVDPTGGDPGHIHLRAGGTQDASTADLYLGGELTCVRVSDTSGIVTVRTTNVGDPNITLDWSFQSDGNLYFPGIGNNRIGESEPGLVVSSDNAVVLQSNNTGESKELLFNTDGSLVFPSGAGQINPAVSDGPGLQVEADGDFEIKVFDSELTAIWSFEPSGSISFPDGTVQTTAFTGTGDISFNGDTISGTQGSLTFGDAENTLAVVADQIPVKIQINDALGDPEFSWLFGTNGVLTLPGEGVIRSNNDTVILQSYDTTFNVGKGIRIGSNGYVYFELGDDPAYFQIEEGEGDAQLVARTNLTIMANGGSTIKQWTFNTDGSLTFPDSTVQTSAWTKRIVAVPTSSLGTTGDLEGDLAFDATYIYYCTQDFAGTVINMTSNSSSGSSNPYIIMYDSNTGWTSDDLTGYTVTGPGGYSGTVTGPSVNVSGNLWRIPVSPNVTQAMGTYSFTSPTGGNIWKRSAWGVDTW